MSFAALQEVRCTIHDFRFAHSRLPTGLVAECPLCSVTTISWLRAHAAELTAHRDLLLKAIDLKRTITRTKA